MRGSTPCSKSQLPAPAQHAVILLMRDKAERALDIRATVNIIPTTLNPEQARLLTWQGCSGLPRRLHPCPLAGRLRSPQVQLSGSAPSNPSRGAWARCSALAGAATEAQTPAQACRFLMRCTETSSGRSKSSHMLVVDFSMLGHGAQLGQGLQERLKHLPRHATTYQRLPRQEPACHDAGGHNFKHQKSLHSAFSSGPASSPRSHSPANTSCCCRLTGCPLQAKRLALHGLKKVQQCQVPQFSAGMHSPACHHALLHLKSAAAPVSVADHLHDLRPQCRSS